MRYQSWVSFFGTPCILILGDITYRYRVYWIKVSFTFIWQNLKSVHTYRRPPSWNVINKLWQHFHPEPKHMQIKTKNYGLGLIVDVHWHSSIVQRFKPQELVAFVLKSSRTSPISLMIMWYMYAPIPHFIQRACNVSVCNELSISNAP